MDSNLMTMGVKGSGNYFQRAAQVVETIENFMHSPDEQIEMEHVPNRWSSKGDGGGITIPPIQRYVFNRGCPKKSKIVFFLMSQKLIDLFLKQKQFFSKPIHPSF